MDRGCTTRRSGRPGRRDRGADGMSGVQTNMTNTRDTPVEALEWEPPVRGAHVAASRGTGGRGVHRGGDGTGRELEVLADATVSLVTEPSQQPALGPRRWGARRRGRELVAAGR